MNIRLPVSRLLYLGFIISWGIGDLINNVNDDFKYIFFFLHLLYLLILFFKKNYISKRSLFEAKYLLMFIFPFFLISIGYQFVNNRVLKQTIMEFLYIFCPIVYVYLICINEKSKSYDFYFKSEFYVSVIIFMLRAIPLLNLQNILSISFVNSYSPFEGIGNADIFFILFIYFFTKNRRFKYLVCLFMCFLSFKRLHLVFAVLYILYCFYVKKRKIRVVSNTVFYSVIAFFLLSPLVINLLVNDNFTGWFYVKTGIDFNAFTMGRAYTINYVINSNYTNYGLGTINDYLGRMRFIDTYLADDLHCDLMRIYFEGTFIGLFALVNNYFKITRKNTLNFYLMVFVFVTLFASHILTTFIFWIFALLFIFENNRKEEAMYEKD